MQISGAHLAHEIVVILDLRCLTSANKRNLVNCNLPETGNILDEENHLSRVLHPWVAWFFCCLGFLPFPDLTFEVTICVLDVLGCKSLSLPWEFCKFSQGNIKIAIDGFCCAFGKSYPFFVCNWLWNKLWIYRFNYVRVTLWFIFLFVSITHLD